MATNPISRFFTGYSEGHSKFSRIFYGTFAFSIIMYLSHKMYMDHNDSQTQQNSGNGNQLKQTAFNTLQALNIIVVALVEINAIFSGLRKACAVTQEPPTHHQNVTGQH